MDKETLRKTYLAKRKALSPEEWRRASDILFEQVKSSEVIGDGPVHIFLPIEKFREVDTWPIIHWLWEQGKGTITSVTNIKDGTLAHVWFDANTQFETDKWGIPEPVGARPADPSACTALFVPLLVADKKGNRIGYGKGFYDGFLASLPKKCKMVGLSLLPLVEETIAADPHDVPLDMVISVEVS